MSKLFLVLSLLLPGALCDLSNSFTVTSYDLSLTVPSDLNSAVGGTVTITLACQTATSAIELHWGSSLTPTTVTTSELTITYTASPSGSPTPITSFTTALNVVTNKLTITTTSSTGSPTFDVNGVVVVTAKFQTKLNADNKGLFYRQYAIENNKNNTVILTNLWPTFARELYPCLDEPRYSGRQTLTLTYPSSWTVASSSTIASSAAGPTTGTTTTVFSPISLPANSFGIFLAENMVETRYSVARSTMVLSFWARKGLASPAFTANVNYLAEYYFMIEDLVGTSLPTNQLTVVMVPGLEEPSAAYGLIFIREDNYAQDYTSPQVEGLYRTNVAPVVYQFLRQFTEFSTRPTTWSDYWVSQAVAKYLQYLVLNTVVPIFDFKTDLEVVARQTALSLDSLPDAKPLQDTSVSTDSTASVEALVNDPLKGLKGAAILNMLDQSLPAGAVFGAIKSFLSTYRGTQFTTAIFIDAIRAIQNSPNLSPDAKTALTTTLPYWFSTTRYPLESVLVIRTDSAGMPGLVNFTTTGFCSALNPSCSTSLPGNYFLSATVGSKSNNNYYFPRQDFWATNTEAYKSINIPVKDTDWVVANMKSGGYYRSTYSTDNWGRIIDAFSSKDQLLLGKTQLLDDAFALNLNLTDALDFNITVRLALANLGNVVYRDWVPVQRGLHVYRDLLLGLDIFTAYKNFAAGYFLNLNAFLLNKTSDPFERARIQALFLDDMCEYDITGYRAFALGNLTNLLRGVLPNTAPSNSYDALACCAARYNTTLKAQTLWNILADSTASYYGRRYASVALGCLSNYTDIKQFYNTMTLTNVQLKPYIKLVLENVAEKNPANFLADFVQLADKFQSQLGAAPIASLIARAGRKVNNITQAAVLDALNNNANVDTVVKTVAQSTKNYVGYKVSWLSAKNQTLVGALKTYTLPSGSSGANILTVISILVFLPSILLTLAPMSA